MCRLLKGKENQTQEALLPQQCQWSARSSSCLLWRHWQLPGGMCTTGASPHRSGGRWGTGKAAEWPCVCGCLVWSTGFLDAATLSQPRLYTTHGHLQMCAGIEHIPRRPEVGTEWVTRLAYSTFQPQQTCKAVVVRCTVTSHPICVTSQVSHLPFSAASAHTSYWIPDTTDTCRPEHESGSAHTAS